MYHMMAFEIITVYMYFIEQNLQIKYVTIVYV